MKSLKKSRSSASASAPQLFAVDFNKEIGKLVAVTGGFWKMKNEDAKMQFDCTVLEYDPDYKFAHLASNCRVRCYDQPRAGPQVNYMNSC
jgi:hypothetical protein